MESIKINTLNIKNITDIVIPVFLTCDTEDNLKQEEIVKTQFVNEIKANVIPEAIDTEKRIFSPVFIGNDNNFHDIHELEFNFHFRERDLSKEGWPIDEDKPWNNIKIGDYLTREKLCISDLLYYLNFTDDDVHYQQERLKKSFMRLSYYDSNEPLSQHLLAYSTVFIDSGELFGKYSQGVRIIDGTGSNSSEDFDIKKRLDTRLTINDKFNNSKSSEGFYLYLFNDEVNRENTDKDIYLKIEFNHAGYGYTLPFLLPYPGNIAQSIPLKGNISLFDCMYIKIHLKYLEKENRYVYFVAEPDNLSVIVDEENQKIIFNTFEANVV